MAILIVLAVGLFHPRTRVTGAEHTIPHIGWSALELAATHRDWTGTILEGIEHEPFVYFVHSFAAVPDDDGHRLADCHYDGLVISAAVGRGNLYGTQFHPEKSGATGSDSVGATWNGSARDSNASRSRCTAWPSSSPHSWAHAACRSRIFS